MPSVVVGDNGERGVGESSLLGQNDLGHIGHVDDIEAPLVEELGLTTTRETWALNGNTAALGVEMWTVVLAAGFARSVDLGNVLLGGLCQYLCTNGEIDELFISSVLPNRVQIHGDR